MPSLKSEWPGFSDVPEDDALSVPRPQGQELARYIWWDGEIREAEQQSVHYYANALHYGTAVFEGIRVYPTEKGPALFRTRDHIERLLVSARIYGMRVAFTADDLIEATVAVTRKNGAQHAYIRPLVFYGHGPIDLSPRKHCPVHAFIAVRGLGAFLGEGALRNGIRVTVASWRKASHNIMPTMAKASGQYASSVLAMHEALDRGCQDAILLNRDGTVSSATGGNVFFVKGGVLYTNDESASIVPGITRASILQLAAENEIPTVVRSFTREELLRAEEVFFTGTAFEVTPVRELDGTEYATGKRTFGALFQRAYIRMVTGKNPKHADWLTLVNG
jgi:branched-chain amino acid aminotransferase